MKHEPEVQASLKPVYLKGKPPAFCDVGGHAIQDVFVDGRTKFGPWGFMCPVCHGTHGTGLGLGKGQKFRRQPDNRWLKVEG